MSTRRNLARYLLPHFPTVARATFANILRAGVLLLVPWPLKFVVDNVILHHKLPAWLATASPGLGHDRIALLGVLVAATLAFGLADASLGYLGNRWFLIAGQRAIFRIRCDLFAHVQRLSLTFHRKRRIGELLARFGADIQSLQDFVVAIGTGLFVHLLTVVGMALVMLRTDWRLAVVALSIVPLLLFISQRYTRLLKRSMRVARRREGDLWGSVHETLASIHLVQAYGREDYEDERFADKASASLAATMGATELQLRFAPIVSFLMIIPTALTLWVGALNVMSGAITAGELLVFLAYVRALATPVQQLAKVAGVTGKATIAVERLDEIFGQESELVEQPGAAVPPAAGRRELEFRAVHFSYGDNEGALHDVSFRVAPGETVALVGATGAGKTTLLGMVARFHDPAHGQILLDGLDLRTLPLEYVRAQVAFVLQDSLLFGGSVWENIAYGRVGASREESIAAARAVGVHDVIAALPNGYDMAIGESGATLSGGQRQCIAIARAMLRDAPIMLLDEPTSGLDAMNERRVMEALRRLTAHRTTLIIAHRLSTVRQANRILVLDSGRIVESGRHDELMSMGGAYSALSNADRPREATIS